MKTHPPAQNPSVEPAEPSTSKTPATDTQKKPEEIGGPKGLEPTRYGDWEKAGRCIDF